MELHYIPVRKKWRDLFRRYTILFCHSWLLYSRGSPLAEYRSKYEVLTIQPKIPQFWKLLYHCTDYSVSRPYFTLWKWNVIMVSAISSGCTVYLENRLPLWNGHSNRNKFPNWSALMATHRCEKCLWRHRTIVRTNAQFSCTPLGEMSHWWNPPFWREVAWPAYSIWHCVDCSTTLQKYFRTMKKEEKGREKNARDTQLGKEQSAR